MSCLLVCPACETAQEVDDFDAIYCCNCNRHCTISDVLGSSLAVKAEDWRKGNVPDFIREGMKPIIKEPHADG